MTKIWLDDVRPAPEGWVWAQSYDEAISLWDSVTDASLDHDLAVVWDEKTSSFQEAPDGTDFLKWIIDNNEWPSQTLAVHSANVVAVKRLCQTIEDLGPYSNREYILYTNTYYKRDLPATRYSND